MMGKRTITFFSLFLLLGGPTSALAQDEVEEWTYIITHTEKKMPAAPLDKALVYILRPSVLGFTGHSWVFVDERFVGVTKAKHYTYALVEPGEHVFWSQAENLSALRMTVEAGKTYFLKQRIFMSVLWGVAGARVKLAVIDAIDAQSALEKCKYVTPTEKAITTAQKMSEKRYAKAKEKAKPYEGTITGTTTAQASTVFALTEATPQIAMVTPVSPTPEKTEAVSTAYRIAIFPAGGQLVHWGTAEDARTAEILEARIRRDPVLTLAYSYYDDVLSEPRIKNPERLWVGGATRKKPNLEVVYTMGRERKADGVAMAWGGGPELPNWGWSDPSQMPITLYLIDVDHRQVYRRKGTLSTANKTTKRVLADFIKGRGAVSPPKTAVALQAPAQAPAPSLQPLAGAGEIPQAAPIVQARARAPESVRQERPSGAYRIAIFPAGGQFGYSNPVDAADILQANIRRDPALALAYSYYDSALNEPRIKKPEKLWVGGATRKKPNLELVYKMGGEGKLDGIVMYWGELVAGWDGYGGATTSTGDEVPIIVYVIDVDRRQVYRRKGTFGAVKKMTKRVLADFIKGRDAVAPPKTVVGLQAPAQAPAPSDAQAQFTLGYRYSLGQGVPKDAAKAVAWYRKAAEQGHAVAQYNLGAAYANGQGVEVSKYTAADWFFKAGQSFLKEGKKDKALQAVDAIERVAPGHFLTKRLLSEIYGQPTQ